VQLPTVGDVQTGERKFQAEPNPNAKACASEAAQKVEERIGVFYQGVKSPLRIARQ
jgi:hypothetical protein